MTGRAWAMRIGSLLVVLGLAWALLAGCGAAGAAPRTPTLPPTVPPEPTPTATPAPTSTPTPKPPATPTLPPTPTEETPALAQEVAALQQLFVEAAARHPEGITERIKIRGIFAQMGGLEGLARSAQIVLQDLLKEATGSRQAYIEIARFLKENPDARLVIYFRTDRAVWCPNKWDATACRYSDPVEVYGAYNFFYGQVAL